jgi:anti-sigma factor RsiW
MTDAWTDRLSEYLDGEMADGERAGLDSHIAQCEACRTTLHELRAVVQQAAALPHREPARDLWGGILDTIRTAADPTVVPFPALLPGRRRFSLSVPQLAAAGLAITAISAGSMWFALRGPSSGSGMTSPPPSLSAANGTDESAGARLVSNVEDNYEGAIRELELALATTRASLDPRTVEVIEQNLLIIDAAIAEARAALADDPSDIDLYRYLDGTLMKKIDLLRRATSLRHAQT